MVNFTPQPPHSGEQITGGWGKGAETFWIFCRREKFFTLT
jgi:hypothetical protein